VVTLDSSVMSLIKRINKRPAVSSTKCYGLILGTAKPRKAKLDQVTWQSFTFCLKAPETRAMASDPPKRTAGCQLLVYDDYCRRAVGGDGHRRRPNPIVLRGC
jgi:hypothetical protein